jgi:hypothetical protein
MHWYLESTSDAAQKLISLIAGERNIVTDLHDEHERLKTTQVAAYENFRTMDLQEDFNDYQVMHAFGESARAYERARSVQNRILETEAKHRARYSSYAAICGALLQIGKQALSADFGKSRNNAPEGPYIGSEPLRNVIWEGRNQSMHFETPDKVGAVIRQTFQGLENSFGSQFHMPSAPADLRNLAGEVIEILGWWEYSNYLAHMVSLLGP